MLPALAALLVAGCAVARIVPVPAPGVEIDATRTTASLVAEGVELAVQGSAWHGRPWGLDDYVTPFLVSLANGAPVPLHYDYRSFRLFDDSRFQYTALPPAEVERILRARVAGEDRLADAGSSSAPRRRRVVREPYWYSWGWPPYAWYGGPWYYPGRPFLDDVYLRALPEGPLQPGARFEGFVYFPRLRPDAHALRLEFSHRVGDRPRVLSLSFVIDRETARPADS
jgi:hypothetical protein